MKGKLDTNAIIGGPDEPKFSDAEISELIEQETEVLISVLSIEKTRPAGAFFPFLNKAIYDLSKYGTFYLNRLIKVIIITIVFISHWKQEGYQISNYRN